MYLALRRSETRTTFRALSGSPLYRSPKLFESLIAPAAITVDFVTDRILFVVVLVIVLRRIELCGGSDFSYDGLFETPLNSLLRFLRELFLRFVMVKDRGPVLASVVAELRIGCERINVAPEDFEKFFVTDLTGVIGNLYRFRVAGCTGRHLFIGRVLLGSAGIA